MWSSSSMQASSESPFRLAPPPPLQDISDALPLWRLGKASVPDENLQRSLDLCHSIFQATLAAAVADRHVSAAAPGQSAHAQPAANGVCSGEGVAAGAPPLDPVQLAHAATLADQALLPDAPQGAPTKPGGDVVMTRTAAGVEVAVQGDFLLLAKWLNVLTLLRQMTLMLQALHADVNALLPRIPGMPAAAQSAVKASRPASDAAAAV